MINPGEEMKLAHVLTLGFPQHDGKWKWVGREYSGLVWLDPNSKPPTEEELITKRAELKSTANTVDNFQAHYTMAKLNLDEKFHVWLKKQPKTVEVEWERRPSFSRFKSVLVDGLLGIEQTTQQIDDFFKTARAQK